VELVLEARGDTEIAAAAAESPEQVGVLLLGRANETTIGR
jgi:hypothetical protein